MNVPENIKNAHMTDELVVAQLAVAYTLLADVPSDNWGHEGTPAEMAVLVVKDAKERGRMGFLSQTMLGRRYGW
jgi:hypothetical protein